MNNGNAVIQRLWRQCQRRAKAIPDSETMSRNSWRKIAKDGLRLLGGGKQFDKPGRETGRASVCSRLRHEWLLGTSSPPLNFRIARCVRLTADTPSAVTRKKRLDRPPAFWRWVSSAGLHVAFCFQTIERGIDSADRHFPSRTRCNLSQDSHAVGLVTKAQNR